MRTHQERRHYTRIDFANDAVLHQLNRRFAVQLIDISLKGVLVEKPEGCVLEANEATYIVITLTEEIAIEMRVELIHNDNNVLGFQCDSIDVESMAHLRRLIELNIQAPNAPERVLEELISPVNTTINRRREKRYPHRAHCALIIGEKTFAANALNISEHGALVAVIDDHHAKPGDNIYMTLETDGAAIALKGQVAHSNLHYIGLQCDGTSEDNVTRVRQLIALK